MLRLVPPLQKALGLFPLLVTFGGQDQKHFQTILLRTISSVVASKALCLIQAGVTECSLVLVAITIIKTIE